METSVVTAHLGRDGRGAETPRSASEEEKIKLENRELVLQDLEGCECQKETTKKISKNKKKWYKSHTNILQKKLYRNTHNTGNTG